MRSSPLAVIRPLLACPVLLVAGCSFSISTEADQVSVADLEEKVRAQAAENNLTATSVDCPVGLEAAVGALAQCELIANGLMYTATAKTTEVEGESVRFNMEVRPPATVPQEGLEDEVARIVENGSDADVVAVECAGDLEGTRGTAVTCDVEGGDGQVLNVVVTVTEADFLNVNFSVNEAS